MKTGDLVRLIPDTVPLRVSLYDDHYKRRGEQVLPGSYVGDMSDRDVGIVLEYKKMRSGDLDHMVKVFVNGLVGWLPSYAQIEVIS